MPLYDFRCKVCQREFEASCGMNEIEEMVCLFCGKEAEVVVKRGPAVHVWKPIWFENIAPEPLYIESKQQLREECKRRNVEAACLM